MLVYFSSVSEMTKRFVEKTGLPNKRIPLRWSEEDFLVMDEPYVLVVPSYGAGKRSDAVPKQVIKFLNVAQNREYLRGVVGGGNMNYGEKYCIGAKVVAEKVGVPLLHTYELLGMPYDIEIVKTILEGIE